jgi:predicted metal-dependent hydrolase
MARSVRLKISQNGKISISLPRLAPIYLAKRLLEQSRQQVRESLAKTQTNLTPLAHGDLIGKSHRLSISDGPELASRLVDTTLHVTVPSYMAVHTPQVQTYIKQAALKALRKQAGAYLNRRLSALAQQHGFVFSGTRFSNAGTRWGSCSTQGTISLNIWLMQLPFELIDYVLLHELCHTREMNHSPRFWSQVEALVPNYRQLRRDLRAQHPYL